MMMCLFGVYLSFLFIYSPVVIHTFNIAFVLFCHISLAVGQRVQFKVGPPANDKANCGKGKKYYGSHVNYV